jgi:CBS domain-containing protein
MGDQKINIASKGKSRAEFIEHLLTDIECLEQMIKDGRIEKEPIRIGSEQEFCLTDRDWTPSKKAVKILEQVNDEHFTTELALYNLEINMDPLVLGGKCFSEMMAGQLELLDKAKKISAENDTEILLTGILPTISNRHIEFEYMTPSPRYKVLNQMLKEVRGSDFSLHIMGTDELTILHDSVLFEACNTSFQAHLQIDPDDFVSSYNWSQAISGPILAISTNSPLLLGKELWSETRIALFQQSIDTRATNYSMRQNEPRVTFGNEWIHDSITDVYKDDITRFKILVSRSIEESSKQLLEKDISPKLEALSLHNGTIYRWNRPCYGVAKNIPHLRIENRYLPAGPTVVDEIANMAYWVGLMKGRPIEFDNVHDKMDFKDAKSNFIKAARYGKDAMQSWMGKSFSPKELTLEVLLPIARKGLESIGIDNDDIDLYLGIIERRVYGSSGAEWQVRNFRKLKELHGNDQALRILCQEMSKNQNDNTPVSDWEDIIIADRSLTENSPIYVYEIMKTQLYTVQSDDSADLVANMMQWKNIHHVPVENEKKEIVGLLTWNIIEDHLERNSGKLTTVEEIMVKNVLTVHKDERIDRVEELMVRNEIGCVPVAKNNRLVGIVTKNDLPGL